MAVRCLVVLLATGCSFRAGLSPSDAPSDVRRPIDAGSAIAIDAAPDAEMIDAPPTGIHFVQGSGSFSMPWNTNSQTLDLTFGSTVAAGDVIAVYFSYDTSSSLDQLTDSAGDTYHTVETNGGADGQASLAAWALAGSSGPLTITAKMNNGDCCLVLFAHEIAGVDTANPVDDHHSHSQNSFSTGTDDVTSQNLNGHAGDYLFGGTTDPSPTDVPAIAAGTGFTLRVDPSVTALGANPTATEDMIVPATASVATTFTFAEGAAITIGVAFSPAP